MTLTDDGSEANEHRDGQSDFNKRVVIPRHIQVMPDDKTFHLDGDTPALSLIVRDRHDRVLDCVAWLEDRPSKWWLRSGNETAILGAKQLAGAELAGFPLQIYPTPADWVAGGGNGVVVLSWGANLIHLFDGLTLDVGHLPFTNAWPLAKFLGGNFRAHEPRIIGLGGDDE